MVSHMAIGFRPGPVQWKNCWWFGVHLSGSIKVENWGWCGVYWIVVCDLASFLSKFSRSQSKSHSPFHLWAPQNKIEIQSSSVLPFIFGLPKKNLKYNPCPLKKLSWNFSFLEVVNSSFAICFLFFHWCIVLSWRQINLSSQFQCCDNKIVIIKGTTWWLL